MTRKSVFGNRYDMLILFWLCLSVLPFMQFSAMAATERPMDGPEVVLVRDGKPAATIVIPKTDVPLQPPGVPCTGGVYALAAQEMAYFIKLATGAELPIVTDDTSPQGTLILIGEGRLTREARITADDLPLEGFRFSTFNRGIAIVGAVPKPQQTWAFWSAQLGTLYGVYDFLERFAGVRWYYPGDDGQIVPKRSSLIITARTYSDAPVRLKRIFCDYPAKGMPAGTDFRAFARRMRNGGSTSVSTGCHTPDNFGIHFSENPECFQLKIDGTRETNFPCYGNPKTVEVMIRDLENFYNKSDKRAWTRPDGNVWGPPTQWTIHISPPDNSVDCHCEYCKPLVDAQARNIGVASRIMVQFVDKMAQEIQKRWPEKTVFFLPYSNYTLPPEGAKLPKNVVAGICLMRGAGNAKEPLVAQDHDAMISGWNRITGNPVDLWEYQCWPVDDTTLPFQYPHVLKEFQQRHGGDVVGSFINGGYAPENLPGEQWALQHWTIYCWMRLLWNPDFDVDAALEEYLTLMYGPAKEPVAEIYKLLIDRWEKVMWKDQPQVHRISPVQIHEETMPKKEVSRLKELLAQAQKSAGENNQIRRRVDFIGNALTIFFAESDRYHSGVGVPELAMLKVGGNPLIDGKLDEPCWRDAQKQTLKKAFDTQADPVPGKTSSYVQAVWTPDGVTFGLTFEEPNMGNLVANATVRNQNNIWWEDCAELFLDVAGKRSAYEQLIVNSLGTLWDGGKNIEGLKAGVNKGSDRWTVELYVPIAGLQKYTADMVKPAVGAVWYGNFVRNQPQDGKPNYQRWNSLGRPNHSDFAAFGRLRFVE